MVDFFNILNDFLKSDMAKDLKFFFAVIIILVIVITAWITWIFFSKVFYKIQLNNIEDVKKENAYLKQENARIKELNENLKEELKEYEKNQNDILDPAFDKFIRK